MVEKIGEDMRIHFENPLSLTLIEDGHRINKRIQGSIDENSYKRSRYDYGLCAIETSTDERVDNSDPRGDSSHRKRERDSGESTRTSEHDSKRQKNWA